MNQQGSNLREALLLAQASMERCEAFLGESNDDSGRAIYSRIGEIMHQQKLLLTQESGDQKGTGWEGKAA